MGTSEASVRRRVKLYTLNDNRSWDDKGTGHVSAAYSEHDGMTLVVISETDGSYLLQSKIQPDTAYQRQQNSLIVWSEGETMDLALSFQDEAGCEDVWRKICNVQGKDPSVEITQEVVDESDETDDADGYTPSLLPNIQPLVLPPCDISHLDDTIEVISQAVVSPQKRERLVKYLESTNYLSQLVDVFKKAEDLKNMTVLHQLYEIIRQLLFINNRNLYEILFSDDMIVNVVGILEYNPSGRVPHRDFLINKANFKQVLPLKNNDLVQKIHQTFRVQYIQECCLPTPCLFEEHTLSQLKEFVSLNKMEIIRSLQDDDEFMCRLFDRLTSSDTDLAHRRDLALFIKEFCTMSMQTEDKERFLNCLVQHGALRTTEYIITFDDRDIKSAALELLRSFIEHQPSVVREYVYKDTALSRKDDELLINLMISQLLSDPDPAALRLIRRVINMKEEFYNRYLVKNDLFKPIVDLLISNGHRYNLIDSAILELFDYIRTEQITSLIVYILDKFGNLLDAITYVKTFSDLKKYRDPTLKQTARHLIGSSIGHQNALDVLTLVNVSPGNSPLLSAGGSRLHAGGSSTNSRLDLDLDDDEEEEEEEQWLDQEDEEEDEDTAASHFSSQQQRLDDDDLAHPPCRNGALLDDEDEDDQLMTGKPPPKRLLSSTRIPINIRSVVAMTDSSSSSPHDVKRPRMSTAPVVEEATEDVDESTQKNNSDESPSTTETPSSSSVGLVDYSDEEEEDEEQLVKESPVEDRVVVAQPSPEPPSSSPSDNCPDVPPNGTSDEDPQQRVVSQSSSPS